jgi:tetratricopeptide (TPR) repeat protein
MYYKKGIKLSEKMENLEAKTLILGNLGVLHKDMQNLDEAEKCLLEYIVNSQRFGNKRFLGIGYGQLGEVYFEQKKYNLAKQHLLQGIEICQEMQNIYHLCFFMSSLAELHFSLQEFAQSRKVIEETAGYLEKMGLYVIKIRVAILQQKLDILELKTKKEKLAAVSKLISLMEELDKGDSGATAELQKEIGFSYLGLDEYEKAEIHLNEAARIYRLQLKKNPLHGTMKMKFQQVLDQLETINN